MEVGEHEVRVVQVDVRPARAEEDAGDAAEQELGDERQRPEHRRRQRDRAAVAAWRCSTNIISAIGIEMMQRGDREDVRHARVDAGDELVVRPHEEARCTPVANAV